MQQLVHYSPPPPVHEEQTEAIWNPFKPIDKKQRSALTRFLNSRKKMRHTVEFDELSKEFFTIMMSSGGWLKDEVCIIHIYVLTMVMILFKYFN